MTKVDRESEGSRSVKRRTFEKEGKWHHNMVVEGVQKETMKELKMMRGEKRGKVWE